MVESTLIKLKTKDGRDVEAQFPRPADVDSFLVFSMHKAGSSMLNEMLRLVCDAIRIPIFEPELVEYNNGLPLESLDPSVQQYIKPLGYCVSGFRSFPRYLDGFDVSGFKKLLLIRDPRDILVSHYFSHKISHHIPPGELGEKMLQFRAKLESTKIDDYALRMAAPLKAKFERYEANVFDAKLKLFRYEDVVFDKQEWLLSMLEYLDLSLPVEAVDSIVSQVDHRPVAEDATQHIRKVTPGDHLEKLQPATIEQLDDVFGDVLTKFGYFNKQDRLQHSA